MNTDTQEQVTTITGYDDAPATYNPEWLPETPWEPLQQARAEHQRLLDARREAAAAHGKLRKQYEQEDEQRKEQMEASYAAGTSGDVDAQATPEADRKVALAEADQRVQAASAALLSAINKAASTIAEHAADWKNDLASRAAQAEEKRAEAARLLEEAELEAAEAERMTRWVVRSERAATSPYRHIAAGALALHVPQTEEQEREQRTAQKLAALNREGAS